MIKSNYVYSSYAIAFHGASLWSFSGDFSRTVLIFGVDISSLSYTWSIKKKLIQLKPR